MKVQLSIADDRELRAHIRDVIKGEVLSIARGEIKGIIAQSVSEKAIPSDAATLERIIKDVIAQEVKNQLSAAKYGTTNWIKQEARKQISEMIKAWALSDYSSRL